MPTLLFLDTDSLEVFVRHREVRLHLVQCLIGDGVNSELLLAFSKVEPQLAPCRVPGSLAKEIGHLGAAIAARQGCLVRIILGSHFRRYHRDVHKFNNCQLTMVG